jgi:YegS/Rv2252/BmrU family lipid kinase
MKTVAVIAHSGKTLGGGLEELRTVLLRAGVTDPLWFEVSKSKRASKQVKRALDEGAQLIFVWGGDGMVQRCVDAAAGSDAELAIVPAGTANLLAANLGIPQDIEAAVAIGVRGCRRRLDVGRMNGERFAVMAGAGFDARMIRDANGALKNRLGRLAYVWTGARNLRVSRVKMRIRVDGEEWFSGKAGCVLIGNVGEILGGVKAFEHARPDDGCLELGIVTADGIAQWARALSRTALGRADRSPFVQTTRGKAINIRMARPTPYELDGGARGPADRLKVRVEPAAIAVCVPNHAPEQ